MPNPNTIPWLHYQDIQIPDVTLQQQFQQYWATGNYNNALNVLLTNQQLEGKAFIANAINAISNGIEILENNYNNNVTIFLSDLANQYNTLISNLINKRTWNATIQYVPYNFVVYNSQIYMCTQQPQIGTLPTDINYWVYIGLRGEQGEYGLNVNMRYNWNPNDTYNINDIVVYGSALYVATTQNSNSIPGTNDDWDIFLVVTPEGINVGVQPPEYPVQNTIWFQTQIDPLTQNTNTPIIGLFNRYDNVNQVWEPMYPNTIFTWVDNQENYARPMVIENITILPNQWVNQEYTYSYPNLNVNSFVQILPVSTLNNEQYNLYSTLSITIEDTNIILATSENNISISLPIIIKIQ